MQSFKKYNLYFLILVYLSGSIGFVLNPEFFQPFTPFTLLLTSIVFLLHQYEVKSLILAYLAVAILGFSAEVIGVQTGLVFGAYHYGAALGAKLLEVPLIISLNWALVITASISIATYFLKQRWSVVLSGALLATVFDVLLEQIAPRLDFWVFDAGMPTLHNYLGWFAIAGFSGFLFYPILRNGAAKPAIIILFLQLIFFISIILFI